MDGDLADPACLRLIPTHTHTLPALSWGMIDPRLQPGMHKWLINRDPIAESHVRPHVLPDCSDALAHNDGRSHKGAAMHGRTVFAASAMHASTTISPTTAANQRRFVIIVGRRRRHSRSGSGIGSSSCYQHGLCLRVTSIPEPRGWPL